MLNSITSMTSSGLFIEMVGYSLIKVFKNKINLLPHYIIGSVKSTYISALLGKATSQLLRLAGIISEFYEAFEYVNKVATQKMDLDQDFAVGLEEYLKDLKSFEISEQSMIRGYNMLEYFSKNKLILSSNFSSLN